MLSFLYAYSSNRIPWTVTVHGHQPNLTQCQSAPTELWFHF